MNPYHDWQNSLCGECGRKINDYNPQAGIKTHITQKGKPNQTYPICQHCTPNNYQATKPKGEWRSHNSHLPPAQHNRQQPLDFYDIQDPLITDKQKAREWHKQFEKWRNEAPR